MQVFIKILNKDSKINQKFDCFAKCDNNENKYLSIISKTCEDCPENSKPNLSNWGCICNNNYIFFESSCIKCKNNEYISVISSKS